MPATNASWTGMRRSPLLRFALSSSVALGAFLAGAAEVLRLPDGSWVGAPVLEVAKPRASAALDPFTDQIHSELTPYQASVGEKKTLWRQLYETLPRELQRQFKSPPSAPRVWHGNNSPVPAFLVFPTGGGWSTTKQPYRYALADAKGRIGVPCADFMSRAAGSIAFAPANLPRRSPDVTLLAWERGDKEDYSQPPVAQLKFRNPLYEPDSQPPLWPDGKVELEQRWRDVTLRLEKFSRFTRREKHLPAGLNIEGKLEGLRYSKELYSCEWQVSDNRGNVDDPRGSRGRGYGRDLFTFSLSYPAFWPENPNWRLTLWLRPLTPVTMHEDEFKRVRIEQPLGDEESRVVAEEIVLRHATVRNVRLSRNPSPPKWHLPMIESGLYAAVKLDYEADVTDAQTLVRVTQFYDGLAPFDTTSGGEHQRLARETIKNRIQEIALTLDKRTEVLEFVLSATRPERVEFYFQPEMQE